MARSYIHKSKGRSQIIANGLFISSEHWRQYGAPFSIQLMNMLYAAALYVPMLE